MDSSLHIFLVGKQGGTNVGHSLDRAAQSLGFETTFFDVSDAFEAVWPVRSFCWHVLDHRPPNLTSFSQRVEAAARERKPDLLLTTGLAPITERALKNIGEAGIRRLNFSTDDPWNENHRGQWFLDALPRYDEVFTPRRANEEDFRELGCRTFYVPFGYDASLFHDVDLSAAEQERLSAEVLFVGGADEDRIAMLTPLIEAGFDVALYGDYWEDYDVTAPHSRGHAPPETIRKATEAADIALCLVRRANRDGHVMRSLEIPAIGACMLVEDTDEHRDLFGSEGESVRYFDTPARMVEQTRDLLARPEERVRLARCVHDQIVRKGNHTYADRLQTMVELAEVPS